MRQGALEIGHWSLIYSKVIQQTMMKGFQQNETNFSHQDVLFTIQQSRQQAIESGSAKLIAGQVPLALFLRPSGKLTSCLVEATARS